MGSNKERSNIEASNMADGMNYKAILKDETSQEGRRFKIDEDCGSSFAYLIEKLKVVFANLGSRQFDVAWVDSDVDEVKIGSDEELMIALSEMTGPVYKISVKINAKKFEDEGGAQADNGEVHQGVTCEGCEGLVIGNRYKCLVCPDYDLCAKCEAKGLHPGHNMMRMASAQGTWPHHIFKRIHRMQERAVNREKCRERGEEDKEAKDENKTENNTWGRRGFRGGRCGMRGRAFQGPNPFEAMMKGWMGAGGMPQCADNEEMKKQHEKAWLLPRRRMKQLTKLPQRLPKLCMAAMPTS